MKLSIIASILITTVTLGFVACTNQGDYKEYNKGKVYYTSNVNESEVDGLGELLVESKIFDGSGGAFKLDYADSTYFVSAVTSEEMIPDIQFLRFGNLMRMLIKGKLFPDNKVVYQFCDKNFNVLKAIASEQDEIGRAHV